MKQDEIRAEISTRLKAGTLPRDMTVRGQPDILIGAVRGYPCAGCDGPDPDVTYRKGDVRIRFHAGCARIWEEERSKVQADD